ncbi:MAG: hypothetical protein J2P13_03080, partial [Acidobacteria bacterium]|nr:hypothetical protein [Acidobacteriota bacterium]
MAGLIQPSPVPEEPDSSRPVILAAIAAVLVLALIAAFLLRGTPKQAGESPPYAAKLKISGLKMSQ